MSQFRKRKENHAHKEHINRYKMAHMIGVAEYMRERALDYQINKDVAYAVGLLHDIGYLNGRNLHEKSSGDILKAMGISYPIYFAIKNHGGRLEELIIEEIPSDTLDILVLLIEADSSVDAMGYLGGFMERLKDIEKRYGKNSPAFITMSENQKFIEKYCENHKIQSPHEFLLLKGITSK